MGNSYIEYAFAHSNLNTEVYNKINIASLIDQYYILYAFTSGLKKNKVLKYILKICRIPIWQQI